MGSGSGDYSEKIASLLDQTEDLETACEFDRIVEITKEVLTIDGNNVRALLVGAGSLVSKEGDEADESLAKEWYQRAIDLEPDSGYEKFFAFAQVAEGTKAIELFERGIRLLDKEIQRSKDVDEKEKLKSDKFEAARSLVEVYIADMNGAIHLNKAKEIVLKLIKEENNNFISNDIFLLAQLYDKGGKQKYNAEIKTLCEAATRRVLTEEADQHTEERMGIFLSKLASFCLDYGFLYFAKHVINKLGLIGGRTTEYLSLKSMCYRLKCDRMLKKTHYYADSCLELIEDMEEEGDTESCAEIKETIEELKNKTPLKLDKLFEGKSETNGTDQEEDEDANDNEDSEADSEDDDEFPLAQKPISAKRYQKLTEAEKKKVLELGRQDLTIDDTEGMDMDI